MILCQAFFATAPATAAPYADFVMDARTGEVIRSRNADTRLHPASLTKMMTLYIAFQAIQRGEITLDTEVTVTEEAAGMPPSRLGLREGQHIAMRYLLRAAAVKSANDAAAAIGIALGGSRESFAERMNATAAAMGMTNTHFVNMNGLTAEGHYSTARDMSVLGRHMIYDFPQYYNLFSRRSADAGMAEVANTNRRFLDSYEGADGIKTGFTNAAGYNIVASAQRGNVRIIATVFGGTSTANRNARVSELLDMGFAAAPANANVSAPEAVAYAEGQAPDQNQVDAVVAEAFNAEVPVTGAHTIRVTGQVAQAVQPQLRPGSVPEPELETVSEDLIDGLLAEAMQVSAEPPAAAEPVPEALVAEVVPDIAPPDVAPDIAVETALAEIAPPPVRPVEMVTVASVQAELTAADVQAEPEVVTRLSASGGRHWGINVGRYNSENEAERVLIQVALNEMATLENGLRRVLQRSGGFDANFMGLTREEADLACRRLQARNTTCFMIGSEEG
jgi:D-alanyl-D-alanine carboxypeptidase